MKITDQQKRQLTNTCSRLGIRLLIAYGSKVSGHASKKSDLDLAVVTTRHPNYQMFKQIYASLSDIFTNEELDIRFLDKSNPLFGMQVVKNGQLIFGQLSAFEDLKADINKRYIDDGRKYFPFHNQLIQEQQKN